MEKFIQRLAKDAGALVLKRFGKDGLHYSKSEHRGDAVTKADLAADTFITSRIKKAYPSHGIISEEGGKHNAGAEYTWVVDPIDGTLNFSLGVPMFGVMICLVHKNKVILTAICLPMSNELFFAKAGKGAYRNGKRIYISRVPGLAHAVGVAPLSLHQRPVRFLQNLLPVAKKTPGIMLGAFGSMAVNACYVACGRRDWFVALVGQTHDFAPVSLLLKEAGCKVTDTKGKPWKFGKLEMVAARPSLHKQLLKLTKGI